MILLEKKTFYIGIWATMVLTVCVFLSQEDKFFAIGGTPVAEVVNSNLDATYRSEDDTRWKSISGGKQPIFDGDKLATGKSSSMTVDFKDGRVAKVGEESNLKVNTIRQSSGTTYILTLPKGSVSIQKKQLNSFQKRKTQFPIIIRSGGRDYVIEPGVEKGVVKTDKGVAEFKGRVRPKPAQLEIIKEEKEKEATTNVVLPTIIVAMEKTLPPPPPPTPEVPVAPAEIAKVETPEPPKPEVVEKPKADFNDKLMPIINPSIATTYYSFKPINAINGDIGTVKWKSPPGKTSPSWKAILEVSSDKWTKKLPLGSSGSFVLKLSDLGPLKQSSNIDGVPCANLKIRGGSTSSFEGKQESNFQKNALKISICSYADAGNAVPLLVSLSSVTPESEQRPILFTAPDASAAAYHIIVTTPSQYAALIPLISKAKSVKIAKSPGMSANGVYIAKTGKVVAQLIGSSFNPKSADVIMGLVNGDFVFKGTKSSLFDATSMNGEQLKEWVRKNTEAGNKLFVHSAGSLISIRRDFLEERQEVAQFVKEIASQIFTEKVEILSFK